MTVHDLPVINATLNAISAVLLGSAYVCIRLRKVKAHVIQMLAAVLTSAVFLTCYIIYHISTKPKSIGLPAGKLKTAYLILLFTHVVLAIVMLPMIITTLWRAFHKRWKEHMRIARPTFFIWFYVSVTGVIVYFFLYHVAPAMYPSLAGK